MAADILARANAVRNTARQAVKIDGGEGTRSWMLRIEQCNTRNLAMTSAVSGVALKDCQEFANKVMEMNPVGGLAGLALYLTREVQPNKVYTWILTYEKNVYLRTVLKWREGEHLDVSVQLRSAGELGWREAVDAANDLREAAWTAKAVLADVSSWLTVREVMDS